MSKLMDNKQQMIHIFTEVVALVGVTIYFNNKNKKLSEQIQELQLLVVEQGDTIKKHEQLIVNIIDNINRPPQNRPPQNRPDVKQKPVTQTIKKPTVQQVKVAVTVPTPIEEVVVDEKPTFVDDTNEDIYENDTFENRIQDITNLEDDLDAELQVELDDLNNTTIEQNLISIEEMQ